MNYISPSAPPLQPQYPPQYTYAVQYPQQPMYTYAAPRPQYYPPQQQMGTGTAMLSGFVIGALAEDILDPTD